LIEYDKGLLTDPPARVLWWLEQRGCMLHLGKLGEDVAGRAIAARGAPLVDVLGDERAGVAVGIPRL
jgi:hypothetical protein